MGLIAQGAKAAYNYLSSPSAENGATDRTNDQTQQDYASADASLQSPTQAGPQTAEGVYPGTAGGNPGTQVEQSASNDDSFSQSAQPDTSDQSGGMSEEDESDSSDSSDPYWRVFRIQKWRQSTGHGISRRTILTRLKMLRKFLKELIHIV